MNLNLISKYRTLLMGIAILWVMFFHSRFILDDYPLILFIKKIGYGGVDIFMLLSGFGVYYSLSKSNSVKDFYKKRILRVIPYYTPIVIIFSLIAYFYGYWPFSSIIHNIFLTGFWFNIGLDKMFDWYIPALMFLYLISPLFYHFFKKNKRAAIIITILAFYIFSYTTISKTAYLFSLTFRAPLYFIGFWLADFVKNHKDYKINTSGCVILFIALSTGFYILHYFYFYSDLFPHYGIFLLPFGLITFPLCLFLAYFFSLFKKYRFPILTFCGTYSLTIYIFHERVLYILKTLEVNYFNYLAIILAFIFAYAWQKIIENLVNKWTSASHK